MEDSLRDKLNKLEVKQKDVDFNQNLILQEINDKLDKILNSNKTNVVKKAAAGIEMIKYIGIGILIILVITGVEVDIKLLSVLFQFF